MTFDRQSRAARIAGHRPGLLACLMIASTGCQDVDVASPEPSAQPPAALALPAWDAVADGRPRPALTFLRKNRTGGKAMKRRRGVTTRAPAEVPAVDADGIVVETPDGSTYRVDLGADDLAAITRHARQLRLDRAWEGDLPRGRFSVEKGLSDGVDDRYRWAGTGMYPKRAIGALLEKGSPVSDCTGTLVGARVVLTAAHCMYDDTGALISLEFVADRDGSKSQPYGRIAYDSLWRNEGWHSNGCYDNNHHGTTYCVGRDFALLVLRSPPADAAGRRPGSFGYGSFSDADFIAAGKSEAGYPWRGSASPASCSDDWLYRTDGCEHGVLWEDGDFGEFSHGCDIGSGHSGGPIWSSNLDDFVGSEIIVGVESMEGCPRLGAACRLATPNSGMRITAPIVDAINSVKALHP